MPVTTAADDILKDFFFFKDNKSSQADDSHEMSKYVFYEN